MSSAGMGVLQTGAGQGLGADQGRKDEDHPVLWSSAPRDLTPGLCPAPSPYLQGRCIQGL